MADVGSLLGGLGVGGNIGKAIVQLELSTEKYLAEMRSAEAQTVGSTSKMGSGFAAFGGLAKTALLGVGVAAVAGLGASVKAAIEAQDAQNKLANTLKNNAMLSDVSAESFTDQADALRDLTGVDDEAIIASQALLGQFKLTGAEVQELIPLVVDLSSKMGIDLEAAAKAVGKATQGNTAGLQRYGIAIEEAAGKGKEFDAVLKGLQGTVGGFAEERAIDEPWRVLAAQFEELAEQVGDALLPILKEVVPAFIDVVDAMKPLLDMIGKLGPAVGLLAKVFGVLLSPVLAVSTAIGSLFEEGEKLNMEEWGGDAYAAAGGVSAFAFAEDGLALSVEEANTQLREQLDAILALSDPTFALIDAVNENETAERELARAQERVNTLRREGKTGTKEYREAVKELDEAALDAAQSEGDLAGAVRRLQDEIKEGKTTRKEAIDSVREIGRAAGLSREDIQKLVDKIRTGFADAKDLATQAGADIDRGLADGINANAYIVQAAAAAAVAVAIAAARREAQATSPSKKMFELGLDLMTGLQEGITDNQQKVIDAAQKVIDKAIKEMERAIEDVQERLDAVLSRASDLRSAVSGGFSDFLDISGAFGTTDELGNLVLPNAGEFFGGQLAAAQQFASILQALEKQGISPALLSQIASAGPEAIPFAQMLLQGGPDLIEQISKQYQAIADIADKTANNLTQDYFGERIGELRDELRGLREDLRILQKPQRIEIAFQPGGDRSLRALIMEVIREMNLSRVPV